MPRIIEKRKIDITNATALESFKTNLASDGTYTFNEEILDASYRHLPFYMRGANLTMVAGAFKVGNIAAFDKDGNIIDVTYNRTGSVYSILNGVINQVNDNIPVLDEFYYKQYTIGYVLEDVLDYQVTRGNYDGITGTNGNLNILQNRTFPSFQEPNILSSKVDTASVEHVWYENLPYLSNSGTKTYTQQNTFYKIVSSNLNTNRFSSIQTNGQIQGTMFNDNVVPTPLMWNMFYQFAEHKKFRGWQFATIPGYQSDGGGGTATLTNFLGSLWSAYQDDGNSRIEFFRMYNNVKFPNDGRSGDIPPVEAPKKFSASYSTPYSTDLIGGILLAYDSVVHIKTVKGIQEFVLLKGSTFNVTDYVMNDKLICFAIKPFVPKNNKLRLHYLLEKNINDYSVNKNDAMMSGNVSLDQVEKCYVFNGGHLESSLGLGFNIHNIGHLFSFSMWVKYSNTTAIQTLFNFSQEWSYTQVIATLNEDGAGILSVTNTDQYYRRNKVNVALPTDEWVCIGITCYRVAGITNQNKVYLNGVEVVTTQILSEDSQSSFGNTAKMYIGTNKQITNPFLGKMKNLYVYNTLLSANEMETFYHEY